MNVTEGSTKVGVPEETARRSKKYTSQECPERPKSNHEVGSRRGNTELNEAVYLEIYDSRGGGVCFQATNRPPPFLHNPEMHQTLLHDTITANSKFGALHTHVNLEGFEKWLQNNIQPAKFGVDETENGPS